MEESIGIKPKRIVLAGDSAGGTLAVSLCLLAFKAQKKMPDGLYLIYPCLSLEDDNITPSIMRSLNDPILPIPYLKMVQKLYMGGYDPKGKDPVFSPVKISLELLKQFPPTRIVVGEEDPFHDDCIKLTEKLMRQGVDVRLRTYKEICHGIINVSFNIIGLSSGKKIVKEGSEIIEHLFMKAKERKN